MGALDRSPRQRRQNSPPEPAYWWPWFYHWGFGVRFGRRSHHWPRCGCGRSSAREQRSDGDRLNADGGPNAPAIDEAIEWLDRAEQAREVAGQIAPPPMSYRPAALTETDAGATVMPSG